jgi:hypothetical protein
MKSLQLSTGLAAQPTDARIRKRPVSIASMRNAPNVCASIENTTVQTKRVFINANDAARLLDISLRHFRRVVEQNRDALPPLLFGSHKVLWRHADVERFARTYLRIHPRRATP